MENGDRVIHNLKVHEPSTPLRRFAETELRRCRLTGTESAVMFSARVGVEILLDIGNEAGVPPESVIARGFVPLGPGLLALVGATGDEMEPFLVV